MPGFHRVVFLFGLVILMTAGGHAQADDNKASAQEAFALAVAKAHARTSLFSADAQPFVIRGKVISRLAWHAIGNGTYENMRIDAEHWQRKTRFADFEQTEMNNDSGHSWIEQSANFVPLRVQQMQRLILFHAPSSTGAADYSVVQSNAMSDDGQALTCYSAEHPAFKNGLPRRYRWCFNTSTGLLRSEDMPLNTHVVYSKYIAFQGKQEFTEVHVTVGNLPILDMEVSYSPVDAHALDGLSPSAGMRRSESASSRPNPEEKELTTVLNRSSPLLPPEAPDAYANDPAAVRFVVGEDGQPLDISVEKAPTQAMAEAALQAARQYSFTPLKVDGKEVQNTFYSSIWFQARKANTPPATENAESSPRTIGGDSSGVYRNTQHSFVFHYPADFEVTPQGQIEEDLHRMLPQPATQTEGVPLACAMLLFRAHKSLPEDRVPEMVSIFDLDSSCIYHALDHRTLEIFAKNAARTATARLKERTVSEARQYVIDGKTFVTISASGRLPTALADATEYFLVVATNIDGHMIWWTLQGPDQESLEQMEGSTLQLGDRRERPLVPGEVAAEP